MRAHLAAIVLVLAHALAAAQPVQEQELPPRPKLRAQRIAAPPSMDGRLDDDVWNRDPPDETFTQKYPREGSAPTESTSVRALYDDSALYFGIRCTQTHAPVVARLTRRDRQAESDKIEVDINTRGGVSALYFEVSAAGVLVDGLRFNDTEISYDFDEVWEAETATTADGWTVEMRLPFRILRFDDEQRTQRWGLQIRRRISAIGETDEWAYIPRDVAGEVSHYGALVGLEDLVPGGSIELRPFVLAELTRRDPSDTALEQGRRFRPSAGLDLKWHISDQLVLDGTLNPDFGTVEADQVIFNLEKVEILYPEKRPFFSEGLDVFNTPFQILYTRRIGHQAAYPQLRVDAPFNDRLIEVPRPDPIYGAVKVVGRLASNVEGGALMALTGEEASHALFADGVTTDRRLLDPTTLYQAYRLKLIDGGNHVGFIGTGTTRFEPNRQYYPPAEDSTAAQPLVLCPDAVETAPGSRCFHDAYVAGADARWRSTDGAYVAHAQVLGSLIANGPPRTIADGTVIASGDVAPAGTLRVGKEGGNWLFNLEYQGIGRKFDPNDAGYLPRQNFNRLSLVTGYHETTPGDWFLEYFQRIEFYRHENWDGRNLRTVLKTYGNGQFSNFWGYFHEIAWVADRYDDREIGNGTALQRAGALAVAFELDSDTRKSVFTWAFVQPQILKDGFALYGEGALVIRGLPRIDLELRPQFFYTKGEPRYFNNAPNGAYLFGRLEGANVSLTLRATYTFAVPLTLQVYAQLFLDSEHYSEYSSYAGPNRTIALGDLAPFSGVLPANPDSQMGTFNANVVLRWEYMLGSTLFLVYTRSQTKTFTDFQPEERARLDFRPVRRGPATDTVFIKASFWYG